MDVQFGPNSVDEPNLLYKLQRKLKVFNTNHPLPNRGYNLVTSSSKYGLVFVASPDQILSVYYLKHIIDKECTPQHAKTSLVLNAPPSHIAVSCDQELLAVTGGQVLCVYRVTDFQNQYVSPSITVKCDVNQSTFVSSMQWNPCMPDTIALAFFDGTLMVCHAATNNTKKAQSKARCLCWSPKGKQLVTGNHDGTLSQFKPDLTPAKMIAPPNLFEGSPVEALAIYWISTFQFAVVYKNATNNSRPAVTIVNTPKAGQPMCLNYEDICYSMGSNRPWYYYLQGLAQWNIIMCSSSNGMEIATVGSVDGTNWSQWCQSDEARPELPLTDKKQENYPVGICLDICAIHQLPWGENDTLPHMPLLLVLSQSGLLTVFNVINLKKDAPQLCIPPHQIALPAVAMTSEIPGAELAKAEATPAAPAPVAQQVLQPQQTLRPQPTPQPQPVAQLQPVAQSQPIAQPQSITPASQGFSISGLGGVTVKPQVIQAQPAQNLQPATILQVPQVKPAIRPQPQPQQTHPTPQTPVAQPKAQTPVKAEPSPQQQEASAALKAEQQRANKLKADQELRNMLLNEVNDFQLEVYNFVAKTRVEQNRLAKQLNALDGSFCLPSGSAAKLRAACALDELRAAAVELKLELVRACAVVAEARTHAEAKDQHQWSQADPLTLKRVSSVKKLAYYVQTQLEQAHRALESRWDDKDSYLAKSGPRMARPLLDDVYQPLVRQQQILARQAGALRALRAALPSTANTGPLFQSHTLLRDTPFKKKDPLSKLTMNILNMSLETQTDAPKESVLSAQKLDALRDMLANHKPTKIKPANIEFRHELAAMTLNYEKSKDERAQSIAEPVKTNILIRQPQKEIRFPANEVLQPTNRQKQPSKQPQAHPFYQNQAPVQQSVPSAFQNQSAFIPQAHPQVHTVQPGAIKVVLKKPEPKPDLISKPISLPSSFAPVANVKPTVPGLTNVARTLFTEEPRQEVSAPLPTPAPPATRGQGFASAPAPPATRGQAFEPTPTFRGQSFEPTPVTRGQGFEPAPTTRGQGFEPTPATRGQGFEPAPSSRGQAFAPAPAPPAAAATRSVLKDMLQSRTLAASNASNTPSTPSEQSDANTFMGQKICSPTAFSTPASQAAAAPPAFTAKPISDINNMFNKFAPQPFAAELKPQAAPTKPKSDETGEPETSSATKPVEKKEMSPFTATFTLKQLKSPLSGASNEPDILKTNFSIKSEPRDDDKTGEKSKENIPSRSTANAGQIAQNVTVNEKNETGIKHFSLPVFASGASSIPTSVTAAVSSAQPPEVKTEAKDTPTEPQKDKPVGSSASSLFAAANASNAKPSIFGASLPSPTTTPQAPSFGSSTTSPPTTTAEKPKDPSDTATTKSASLLFGSAVASQPAFGKPASGSIFASTTTTASTVFGSSQKSIFGSTAVSSEVTTTSSATATPPVASAASAITTPPASPKSTGYSTPTLMAPTMFAATTTAPAFPASPTSVFATATTASAFRSSVFGSPTTTGQSLFGTTTSTSQSVFGTPATTQASVFGPPTTTQASIFGAPATSQASVFGAPATTQASVFGAPTTTQASVFGAPATTQASVFGAPATTQASVFGSPSTTQASVFGSPQTTQASVFGSPTTTTASGGSLFGGAEGSLFAAASISTTSASTPSGGGGSIFGGGTSGSVFGGGSPNIFGGKTTFGQNNAATSIFGGSGAATGFGQKAPATDFWSGGNAAGNGQPAAGFGSGFGQQPTTQASSIFGGGTGGSFSQPSGGQPFGSPQPSVFGSPQQQTGASGFGGSPAFASKPAFGQTASFGGSAFGGGFNKSPSSGFGGQAAFGGGATFGGGAAFGSTSPAKLFGGAAAATPGFGAPAAQANATFENFATQNTLTFGNLAQTAQQPPQPQPFSASPSFTGWRG